MLKTQQSFVTRISGRGAKPYLHATVFGEAGGEGCAVGVASEDEVRTRFSDANIVDRGRVKIPLVMRSRVELWRPADELQVIEHGVVLSAFEQFYGQFDRHGDEEEQLPLLSGRNGDVLFYDVHGEDILLPTGDAVSRAQLVVAGLRLADAYYQSQQR